MSLTLFGLSLRLVASVVTCITLCERVFLSVVSMILLVIPIFVVILSVHVGPDMFVDVITSFC